MSVTIATLASIISIVHVLQQVPYKFTVELVAQREIVFVQLVASEMLSRSDAEAGRGLAATATHWHLLTPLLCLYSSPSPRLYRPGPQRPPALLQSALTH